MKGALDFIDLNIVDNEGQTPLSTAIENNDRELALLLLIKGAGVNKKGKNKGRPGDIALSENNAPMKRLLLKYGINMYYDKSSILCKIAGWEKRDDAIISRKWC